MIKTYKGLKSKADKLFSEVIRSIGYCESCLRTKDEVQLQCAHICSRRFNATRCDTRNAYSLCARCHRYYTDHPREFSHFITRTWAQEYYDTVHTKTDPANVEKVDWNERIEWLKRIKNNELTLKEARELE